MDPERLIVATSHAKYGEAVEFPAAATDTGVYFNNGKKGGEGTDKDNVVYANTSAAQKVTNKSSHSIDLTVKAEAVAGTNDIPLVANDEIGNATEASLYLGLKVGSETAVAVDEETAATKTVSIAGTSDNFDIFVNQAGNGYEYRALTLDEYKALDGNSAKTQEDYDGTWKTSTFQLEGAVTEGKEITSTTSAPSIKVTWSWVDPSAGPQLSIDAAKGWITLSNLTSSANISTLFVAREGESVNLRENTLVNWDVSEWTEANGGTCTCKLQSAWAESEDWQNKTCTVTATLTDGSTITKTFTMPTSFTE